MGLAVRRRARSTRVIQREKRTSQSKIPHSMSIPCISHMVLLLAGLWSFTVIPIVNSSMNVDIAVSAWPAVAVPDLRRIFTPLLILFHARTVISRCFVSVVHHSSPAGNILCAC